MKKVLLAICLIFAMLLSVSCDSKSDDTIKTVLAPNQLKVPKIFEGEEASEFGTIEYTDENAQKVKTIELFGETYSLTYKNSATIPMSDMKVHVYNYAGREGYVYIDTETGKAVKATNIPYEEKLSTEDDYVNAISEMFGDLSQYGYKNVSTHIYRFSEGGMESTDVDGFHNCAENEKFGSYKFYYQKTVGDIKTLEHLSVEFGAENTLLFELIDLNYDTDVFHKITDNINSFEKSTENYLKSNLKDGYKIKKLENTGTKLFTKDGVPYVSMTYEVSYISISENNTVEFTTYVSTISRLAQ